MRVLNRIKTDRVRPIMKGWPIKLLSTVVLTCMATSAGHTSDREIYQAAQGGNASIMMMLDNSISMGHSSGFDSIKDDYNIDPRTVRNCFFFFCTTTLVTDDRMEPQLLYNDQGVNIGEVSYRVYYRTRSGQPYYDRMSRLKMALIPLLANPKTARGFGTDVNLTKYKIGLGSFLGSGGNIDAQIADLTFENRKILINKIIALEPTTTTPIANAYAEAGAYMLKGNTSYSSPMPATPAQCDGYGVYFLTDGEPNGVSSEAATRSLMNTSLSGSSLSVSSISNPKLTSEGTYYRSGNTPSGANVGTPGWELIGQYAKALNSDNNSKKDAIATATVGFGSVYKELYDRRTIVGGKDTYNCNDPSVTSQDAKNLCNLGKKDQGFGEGGFYYTAESDDIAKSVKSFIKEIGETEIEPISAGTMSVPLDSLGGLESRQFAYLPILEPVPGSSSLWNGNLKKYKVRNATLLGGNDSFVFSGNSGLFAKNTYDLWNTLDSSRPDALRPDGGAPQVGGAYQKVFENVTTSVGNRNLFVDVGSNLVNPQVVAGNKPANFGSLAGYTNPQKLTLLNFMGYGEPVPTAPSTGTPVTDGTAITASLNTSLKNIGGVLHSIPQLITKKVAVDATGKFDTSKREDYVIYGSMDGALHMLDDSTGKEVFTFVPKQILDLQPKALAGNGSAEDGSYPYGVDAPWLTYASYTTKATPTGAGDAATTVNTYEADQSFALGGLRMGGSMYYALDVSIPSTPKMIYSVGSNYANKLQDQLGATATVLAGTTSSTTSNAAEQQAFAKMGQSWGKPALGYVKSGGKRVMVSFLPGGYDTCYEDAKFKLSTSYPNNAQCNNKAAAQGNGVYMVQMGEVKTKTNNEEKVDAETGNGKLLWWANNSGTSVTATSASMTASLQYSKATDLKHSVVTQIRTLDRNYDGLTDHIYFADLGGQVWRADINNNADTNNFKVDRVVKVLDVSDQVGTGDAPPRIYERPLITFYNGKFGYTNAANQPVTASGVQAMVTVGTGDRSNPVTATRSVPNALYSIIDKDVARSDLFFYGTGTAPTISLRTPVSVNGVGIASNDSNKLQKLTFTAADIGAAAIPGGAAARDGIKENMQSGAIQGWYMPFDTWLNEPTQTTGSYKMKMFNEPDALAGILVSSSYNPDKGQAVQACSAGVIGATQRERTCLPYGTCLDGNGNGVVTARSTFNAGSGIVDNIVTQFNDTSIFSSLVNRCEGDACKPKVICPNGDCDPDPAVCTGPDCDPLAGVNTDKRINPLSWIEH
ncbi:hypothetical protein [Psychrobacter sp. M13]|uniref:hypothetical protein n=1 Tax=Psychrobacter sp. M13 TaxID=3067275 RepID=UPI00273B8931|nr:hypothetical protein [Psychrobacter sp. M13]WLP94842.1 hypothetical protein Q9G97_01605 [Psychrobacter sp. M13]